MITSLRTSSALLLTVAILSPALSQAARVQTVHVRALDPAVQTERTYFVPQGATDEDAVELRDRLIEAGARNVNLILPERVIVCDLSSDPALRLDVPAGFDRTAAPDVESRLALTYASWNWIVDAYRSVDDAGKAPPDMASPATPFKDVVVPVDPARIEEIERNIEKSRRLAGLAPSAADVQEVQQSSSFLGSSVLANFIYAESNGDFETNSENWSDADLIAGKQGAFEALLSWQGKFPKMDLSFTFQAFERIATGYEPINHSMRNDPAWVLDLLRAMGWGQTNDMIAEVTRFNQDQRALRRTQWVFSAFIANSRNTPNFKFGGGTADYTAYAFLGGPCLLEPFPAGVDINDIGERLVFSQIVNHEAGHCFWTLDEYLGAPGGCNSASGYLNYVNGNISAAVPGGGELRCNQLQECIMHTAARKNIGRPWCMWSEGHLGVIDHNDNGLPDIFEAPPRIEFNVPGADTVTTNAYTLRVHVVATAVPNKNPNLSPDKRFDYALPLRGAWLSVGETRIPLEATDGSWDEVAEDCQFQVQLAQVGRIAFTVQAENDIGYKSDVTSKVVYFVGVNYSRTAVTAGPNRINVSWEIAGDPFHARFDVYRLDPGEALPGTRIAVGVSPSGPARAGFIPYLYSDRDIVPGRDYRYYVEGGFSLPYGGGTQDYVSRSNVVAKTAMIPITGDVLSNVAPNPSRGSVTVSVQIPRTYSGSQTAPVRLATPIDVSIYSVNGQRVRTLRTGNSFDDVMTLHWDGTNERNEPAPSGIYFVRALAGSNKGVSKIVLLR